MPYEPRTVSEGAHPFLLLSDAELLKQCALHTYTASGPGGQKRNRTYSAVRLTHAVTGLSVIAGESRSQHENRARACRRLRKMIALRIRPAAGSQALLPKVLLPYICGTSAGINPKNEVFPIFCATLLDLLYTHRGSLGAIARIIGISTGRTGKLFAAEKDLFFEANRLRVYFGLKPLKR